MCPAAGLAYPKNVPTFLRRASPILRASLLALLVLGLVTKPVLTSVFELHAADHAVAAHADDPSQDQSAVNDHDPSGRDDQPQEDRTQSGHGLWHVGHCGVAYADTVVALSLPLVPYQATVIPLPLASPVALRHITGPFRPPIA